VKSDTYDVLWPLARKAARARSSAARLPDLSGRTVALLWDYIFRGDLIYPYLQQRLGERYPGIRFVSYEHFGNIHGRSEREIVAGLGPQLRDLSCDAVISGIGA
jgi:hypothetical protein